ncbi:MAG: hypothetical protein QOJ06_2751 [Pseudonocardiales bacterium]|nr:hypothetical protein [Pseudonocardiales bacterium]
MWPARGSTGSVSLPGNGAPPGRRVARRRGPVPRLALRYRHCPGPHRDRARLRPGHVDSHRQPRGSPRRNSPVKDRKRTVTYPAQQPPQRGRHRAVRRVIRDDQGRCADARCSQGGLQCRRLREGVASIRARRAGQVAVHVEEDRAGQVTSLVAGAAGRPGERPPTSITAGALGPPSSTASSRGPITGCTPPIVPPMPASFRHIPSVPLP